MRPGLWPGLEKTYRVGMDFMALSELVRGHTGMDEFRKFTLWQLVGQAAKLRAGSVLEVGCGNGGSGLVIAVGARSAFIEDPVYLCDTFAGLVKAEDGVDGLKNGDMAETSAEAVAALISGSAVPGVSIITGVFPEDWPLELADRFRFVHLDVDTYKSTKDSFEWVWPRLVQNGIVVIDDYGDDDCAGVTKFVEEAMRFEGAMWFLNGSGQAAAVKRWR